MEEQFDQSPPPNVPSPAVPVPSYAGFWIRLVAHFIDIILVTAVYAAVTVLGGTLAVNDTSAVAWFGLLLFLVQFFVPLAYYVLMEGSQKQATLGKMALGLRVTDVSGLRISYARAIGRYLGKIVSALTFGIGFLLIAFTEKKQGLHDMIAGTLVVKGR